MQDTLLGLFYNMLRSRLAAYMPHKPADQRRDIPCLSCGRLYRPDVPTLHNMAMCHDCLTGVEEAQAAGMVLDPAGIEAQYRQQQAARGEKPRSAERNPFAPQTPAEEAAVAPPVPVVSWTAPQASPAPPQAPIGSPSASAHPADQARAYSALSQGAPIVSPGAVSPAVTLQEWAAGG